MSKYKYILIALLWFQFLEANAINFYVAQRSSAFTYFEFRFLDEVANRADLRIGNILYEFKSWTPGTTWWNNFFSGTGASYNQFKTYLSSIDNLGLKYVFDPKKIIAEVAQGETVDAYMKGKFKDLFSIPEKQTEIFDIIWANTMNNKIFKFIKAE